MQNNSDAHTPVRNYTHNHPSIPALVSAEEEDRDFRLWWLKS